MKNALFTMFIIASTVCYANLNFNPKITKTAGLSNEPLKNEKRKEEREEKKNKRKKRHLKKEELREATDSLYIQYDARSGIASKSNPGNILENGTVIFEIKEINLFRYNISLTENQNDIITNTSLSNGVSLVNIDPLVFNVNIGKLDIRVLPISWSSNLIEFSTLQRNLAKIESEIKKCNQELIELNEPYNNSKKIMDRKNDLDKKIIELDAAIDKASEEHKEKLRQDKASVSSEIDKLNREKSIESSQEIINAYKSKNEQLTKLITDSDNLKFSIDSQKVESDNNSLKFQAFNKATEAYKKTLTELNQLIEFYHRLISILYSDQSFATIYSEKMIATQTMFNSKDPVSKDQVLDFMFQRLREIDLRFEELSNAYSVVSGIIVPPNDKKDKVQIEQGNRDLKTIEEAKDIYNKISNFHNQLNTSSYHSLFLQIAKVYDAINETNFSLRFQTNIVSDNADVIRYSLKAEPHNNIPSSIETKAISFNYNINVIGGYKIDLSTGVFWNLGLMDYSYRFESVTDSTTRVVKEKNENLYIPSIGLLLHLYKRSNKNAKFGWNVGFSTNTQNLNYYTGFSLLLGKSERVNINLGLAGGQVKRVSDLYNTDKILPFALSDLPNEVPLRNPNPFKLGAYFGISFNLLGSKNKQAINQISVLQ